MKAMVILFCLTGVAMLGCGSSTKSTPTVSSVSTKELIYGDSAKQVVETKPVVDQRPVRISEGVKVISGCGVNHLTWSGESETVEIENTNDYAVRIRVVAQGKGENTHSMFLLESKAKTKIENMWPYNGYYIYTASGNLIGWIGSNQCPKK